MSPGRPHLINERQERTTERNIYARKTDIFNAIELERTRGFITYPYGLLIALCSESRIWFLRCEKKEGILTASRWSERFHFIHKNFSNLTFAPILMGSVLITRPIAWAMQELLRKRCKRNDRLSWLIFGFWGTRWFVERDGKTIVAILYGKQFSCIYCEQYDKLDGHCYEDFVPQNFPKGFRRSGKHGSKLLVQDKCAKARRAV